ncbi:MAG: peptide MFS transporter [bacterium]|nr:peptide MFS transporter [bacterium]
MDKKMSFMAQVRTLPANFWFANIMEMLERLAFYAVRAIAPLFLVASGNQNGLGLDYTEKGWIYAIWALLQCLIPMVSGGYTDRYGYKKSLTVAFFINIAGFLGMAQSKPIADYLIGQGWDGAGFWVFLAAACLIGTGTAIFKPPVAATVARCTDERTSSLGWGFFYWVVNIGGAIGPMLAAYLRADIDWHIVFYAAAIVTAANFLPMLFLYKEPPKIESSKKSDETKGAAATFVSSVSTVFKDPRLVIFLGIFSCFWLMFMQLWDLLPNFIDEWVDSSDVAGLFGSISQGWVTADGQVKPEMIINIDSIAIVALVIPISYVIGRISKISAMIVGMLISLVGFVAAGSTTLGWVCCLMVFIFALGEMACSPTFSAYIGLIAPKDRKALYMGYSNIPYAIGWAAGGAIGGYLYDAMGSKYELAREYLVDRLGMDPTFALDDNLLPKERVMESMTYLLDGGSADALQQTAVALGDRLADLKVLSDQQAAEVVEALDQVMGEQTAAAVRESTQILWDLHHPYQVWYYLGAIGLLGTIGMIVFYFATRRTAESSTEEPAT